MKQYLNTTIIAVAIILTGIILGAAWKRTHKTNESISVTGLATEDFISDLIVWDGYFTAESESTKDAYTQIKKDAEVIKTFLIEKGLNEKEIVFSSVNISTNYEYVYDKDGNSTRKFKGYTLTQNVTIESKEVDKVETVSREASEMIDLGVNFISYSPSYYYTKLSELKISMLSKATEDARSRAEAIATNSKADLGSLKKANMGIFQITAQNGDEDFTYGGVFNTSAKEKTASVTIRLEFGIN
jgi:uncharacterized protein